MPRERQADAAVSEDEILDHLSRARRPQSLREIAAALGLRHAGRRELAKLTRKMKKRGAVQEYPNGRIALSTKRPSPRPAAPAQPRRDALRHSAQSASQAKPPLGENQLTGRLVAHRDGYGFVVPDTPRKDLDGDLFIGRESMNDAMHGDRVLASIERREWRGRAPGGLPAAARRAEGRILRVLERAQTTVVGLFRYGPNGNTVLPYETRLVQEIVIPPGEEMNAELREKMGLPQGTPAAAAQPRKAGRLPELDGAVVNVEITRFPRAGVPAAGRITEILGRPGDFGVDVEILIRKHHLPHIFPTEVLAEASAVVLPVNEAALSGRRDFRHLPIVTIDGETARDFDDAVYVSRLANGHWELQVHIADVAHYVRPGSALDREARVRGTSVYFPNRAVPMLPEELSNGICSLRPREDRMVMSAIMEIDGQGQITRSEFTRGVIRSAERMTYTAVHAVLQNEQPALTQYAHLAEQFRVMRDLALILNARRVRLGSIDFDLPEPVIEFDEAGQMSSITRSVRNIAHRIIEEFMLAANQAVARYLDRRGIGSLHRVHEKPDPKKILEFEELAHTFGYSLGIAGLAERRVVVRHGTAPQRRDRDGSRRRDGPRERPMLVELPADVPVQPVHYQRLIQKVIGKPEERIVSYLMLRSLKQARYTADPLGHFALAFQEYTHFTSPIRRYPDLIVHRILKWALDRPETGAAGQPGSGPGVPKRSSALTSPQRAGETGQAPGPYGRGELQAIAEESSEDERRAEAAERELVSWKTAQFMEQHLGDEFEALIVSVQKFGFFVELMEVFVEGLVPVNRLEELTGEPIFYRERDHALVSGGGSSRSGPKVRVGRVMRTQRVWKLGDRIAVRAERIDPIRRRVEFSPLV